MLLELNMLNLLSLVKVGESEGENDESNAELAPMQPDLAMSQPEIRRSSRHHKQPVWHKDYVTNTITPTHTPCTNPNLPQTSPNSPTQISRVITTNPIANLSGFISQTKKNKKNPTPLKMSLRIMSGCKP